MNRRFRRIAIGSSLHKFLDLKRFSLLTLSERLVFSLLTLMFCESVIMAFVADIEMQMADMDIDNEENEELVFDEEVEEEVNRFDLCLVGRFLTEKNINIRS